MTTEADDTRTKDFSLSSLVAEVWETEQIEDLHDFTRKVIAAIPADRYDDMMFKAMTRLVRNVLAQARRYSQDDARGVERDDGMFTAKPAAGRSRWLDSGEIYKRMLAQPETVGDNLVKPLGDLTRDEVLAAAGRRMTNARSNFATAKRYEALAAAMAERQASTVGDLDQPTLLAVFA